MLEVKDLRVHFRSAPEGKDAVKGISFSVADRAIIGLVGESGSGKSVTAMSICGLLPEGKADCSGSILLDGLDLLNCTPEELRCRQGTDLAVVFQEPMTSLDPVMKIGPQVEESLCIHTKKTPQERKEAALAAMAEAELPDPEVIYDKYPHELSGGMLQRVMIAAAIISRPKLLLADEPTTALDVTIQAQILDLIRKLQREQHMTIIYITHDLGVVANVADRVAVMYAGQIVEIGMVNEIFFDAWHPYTWALLGALPQLGVKGEKLPAIDGTPPNLFNKVVGDSFAPRNHQALNIDFLEEPPLFDVTPTHQAKTWMLDPRAPKINQPDTIRKLSSQHLMDAEPISHMDHPHLRPDREPLIEVKDLQITFGSGKKKFVAVDDVNFTIYRGETFSLVGESGSGKTTIGRAIVRINPITNGEVLFKGRRITGKISRELDNEVIRSCQMIFQDPMASLNERAKVDYIVSEGIINYHLYKDNKDRVDKVQHALEEVGLLPEFSSRFPHEFSGGQRQRIGIARSLIMQPEFIVADEPISALDVSIRAQVLNLLNELKKKRNLTYLFIAHDLSVVRFISDRIAVIHKGRIVELAEAEELFRHPLHPYTRALLSAVPNPNPYLERSKKLLVYDPSVHDYSVDKPEWCEILPDHFVYGNAPELDGYRKELGL